MSSNLFILLNLSIKTKQIMIACKNYKIINGENDDEIDVCVCEYDDENSPPSPRTPLVPLLSWEHSSGMNSDRLELFHPHYCWMELYSNNPEWDLASLDPQNSCRPNDPILHTIGIYTTIHYSYSSALGRHLTSNSISLTFHMSLIYTLLSQYRSYIKVEWQIQIFSVLLRHSSNRIADPISMTPNEALYALVFHPSHTHSSSLHRLNFLPLEEANHRYIHLCLQVHQT